MLAFPCEYHAKKEKKKTLTGLNGKKEIIFLEENGLFEGGGEGFNKTLKEINE